MIYYLEPKNSILTSARNHTTVLTRSKGEHIMRQYKGYILYLLLGTIFFAVGGTVNAQNAAELQAEIDALKRDMVDLRKAQIELTASMKQAYYDLAKISEKVDSARYWLTIARSYLVDAEADLANANDENREAAEEWAAYWRSVVIDLADYLLEVQTEYGDATDNLSNLQIEYQKNNVRIDSLAHEIAAKEAELEQIQGN